MQKDLTKHVTLEHFKSKIQSLKEKRLELKKVILENIQLARMVTATLQVAQEMKNTKQNKSS